MRKFALLAVPMLLALFGGRARAQTVTFTTHGGPCCQYDAYTVVTEDGAQASGTVQIATAYGYPQSGIVLPYNPTTPGEYLNPVIDILSSTYTGNFGDPSRSVTFNFDSTENMYGYTWSGTFTSTLVCIRHYRGRCSGYGPGEGAGTMVATPVQ